MEESGTLIADTLPNNLHCLPQGSHTTNEPLQRNMNYYDYDPCVWSKLTDDETCGGGGGVHLI